MKSIVKKKKIMFRKPKKRIITDFLSKYASIKKMK